MIREHVALLEFKLEQEAVQLDDMLQSSPNI